MPPRKLGFNKLNEEEADRDATTVAVDLAKDVFEVATANRAGRILERKRLTRRQFEAFVDAGPAGTRVVMEACGTAHYWGRRCQAHGHDVQLLPVQYVKPYVRRNKTDRMDTEAQDSSEERFPACGEGGRERHGRTATARGGSENQDPPYMTDPPYLARPWIRAQESFSVTVRLNTGPPGLESGSAQKYPRRSN